MAELQDSLSPVFKREASAEVQALKNALDRYDPKNRFTFISLVKAIAAARPYIEKHIPFDRIQPEVNALATTHGLAAVNWDRIAPGPRASSPLPSSVSTANNQNLIPWLSSKTQRPFDKLKHFEQILILLDHCNDVGFSQKLSAHLKTHPDFLFNFILQSERSFSKICASNLNLYITDVEIAKAIIHHMPHLVRPHPDLNIQVEQLIKTLNNTLSKGRSVNTLLRNTDAKLILDGSKLFQAYESDAYQQRHQPDQPSKPRT